MPDVQITIEYPDGVLLHLLYPVSQWGSLDDVLYLREPMLTEARIMAQDSDFAHRVTAWALVLPDGRARGRSGDEPVCRLIMPANGIDLENTA
jgi:hypothetical protein